MKTDFAYIEKTTEAAVLDRPAPPMREKMEIVAGFNIPVPTVAKQEHVDKIREMNRNAETYVANRTALGKRLEVAGIAPLAFIPQKQWEEICLETKLYRLYPTWAGKVNIDSKALKKLYDAADLLQGTLIVTLYAICYVATASIFFLTMNAPLTFGTGAIALGVSILAALIPAGVISWFAHLLAHIPADCSDVQDVLRKRELTRLNRAPSEKVAELFFPGYVEAARDHNMTSITFPQPDDATLVVLQKLQAAKIRPHIAATADAIHFINPAASFMENFRAAAEEKRLMRADPILYITEGNAVAIVAQFGDFPIEKEVVDRVVGTEL